MPRTLDELGGKKPDEESVATPAPAAPVVGLGRRTLDQIGHGVVDPQQQSLVPSRDREPVLTQEQRVKEVFEFGGDPGRLGFDPVQDPEGGLRALRDPESGDMVAFKDFKTGEVRPGVIPASDISTEMFMRSIPGSEGSGLESIAREMNKWTPGEIARFGIEWRTGEAFGRMTRGAKALKLAPKFVRAVAPALAEGAGAGAASLAAETFDPTGNAMAHARNVALFDAAGAGIADSIGHFVLKGGFKTDPGAHEAFDELKKRGVMVTPGRLSSNRLIDIAETGTEASFAGGGSIVNRNEAAQAVMQQSIDDWVRKFTKNMDKMDVDNLLFDALTDRGEMWKATGRGMYEKVDELIDDKLWVDVTDAMLEANEVVRVEGASGLKGGVVEVANGLLRQLPPEYAGKKGFRGADYVGDARVTADDRILIPWWLANELRSTYSGVGRTGQEWVSGSGAGAAKRLASSLHDSMENSATALNGDALDAWKAANAYWREGHEVFDARFVKALLQSNPDDVFQAAVRRNKPQQIKHLRRIVTGTENPAEEVRKLKKARRVARESKNLDAVAEAEAEIANIRRGIEDWQTLQGAFLKTMLDDTTRRAEILNPLRLRGVDVEDTVGTATGRLLPRRAAVAIEDNLQGFGEEAFKEMFPNEGQRKTFRKLVRVLDATQRPAGKNIPGRIAVQLNQAGAIIAIVSLPVAPAVAIGTASVVFGAPAVASRVLTNDKFVEWTIKGAKAADPAAKLRHMNRAFAIAIAHGATYKGDDPELLKQQAERDENFGPGSSRIGSKTPTPRKNRTALP